MEGSVWADSWPLRLCANLAGYLTLLVPFFLLIRYYKRRHDSGLLRKHENGVCDWLLRLFVFGSPPGHTNESNGGQTLPTLARPAATPAAESSAWNAALLLFCFLGLQVNHLTWGVLQEKIMTRSYTSPRRLVPLGSNGSMSWNKLDDADETRFTDSQFLVLANRMLAFVLSAGVIVVCWSRQPRHAAPLYTYSYASMANILSSWFQYEALKYISFPTQVLGKASKVIAVMLMGRCVSRKSYTAAQYACALAISIGVSLFLISRASSPSPRFDTVRVDHLITSTTPNRSSLRRLSVERRLVETTSLSGLVLMLGYLVFDSFTTNWQDKLFASYAMSSVQMMCGVNLFSAVLTLVAEIESGGFVTSLEFALGHAEFVRDLGVLSICSAIGQLFIYYTIEKFGALTFTIMMTVRQVLAIFLSCLIYGHPLNAAGAFGIVLVFGALFVHAYLRTRKK